MAGGRDPGEDQGRGSDEAETRSDPGESIAAVPPNPANRPTESSGHHDEGSEQGASGVGADQGTGKEGRRVRLQDIAEEWGCSIPYVSKLKRQGCPVDSIEEATRWREENSSGRGAGFRSKGGGGSARVTDGGAEGGSSRKVGAKRRNLRSIEASLKGAIEMEEEARWQVERAVEKSQDSRLPNLLGAYNKAQEGRFKAEERVQKLQQDQRELVPLSEAKEMVSRILGTLFSRLRAVPSKAAPRANPTDDLLAEGVIRTAIDEAIEEAHKLHEAVML